MFGYLGDVQWGVIQHEKKAQEICDEKKKIKKNLDEPWMKARRTEPTPLVFKAQIEKSALPTKTPLSYLPLMSQQTTIIGLESKNV
jgi:hypothetical protein